MPFETPVINFGRIAMFTILFLCSVLLVACSNSLNDAEKFNQSPPSLYDVNTADEIPASQQWMIPPEILQQHDAIKIDPKTMDATKLFGDDSWLSPEINYSKPSGQLFIYIDYAGKEENGNGDSEIYSIPICMPPGPPSSCSITYADVNTLSSNKVWPYAATELDDLNRTIYATNHTDHTSTFYGHSLNQYYHVDGPQSLSILLNTFIQPHHHLNWLRVSINNRPITLKKLSFFLTTKYLHVFQWLLLLLPLLIIYDYRKAGGFENSRALITGGLLTLLGTLNALIWDINYMVISCLLIALSGVYYIFANHVYKITYGLGYLTMLVFAYQYYGGFNTHTLTQLGLPTLIGIGIYLKEPD